MTSKLTSALVSMILVAGTATAQEKSLIPRKTPTPLKLQIVYSRLQGEKKISSIPYLLAVNADDRFSQLRLGIEVPIQVGTKGGEVQFQYKNVGTSMDCGAEALDEGRFKINCTFEQSSVYSADRERNTSTSAIGEVPLANTPLFRTFKSSTNLILRDGQTSQYTAATDPVSGEVLKIDVTLNVVK